ncbi:hypothetical protein [Sphingobium ummariense]|uniref:Uncharacterized protein n=1 Tax=Sphingobium ummariense RL-3 TaxID=1346791 RepID=T0J6D0_9SPHN|nr:hypothetical protein [Sphingobium ummariense]EQB33536.1 hypothetical protein M529_03775 [Sphingobium ummariense RL-3]
MNKERRTRIEDARAKIADAEAALQAATEILEQVRDDEQAAYDNMPPSLQEGERGQKMQESIGALDEALSEIELVDFEPITGQLDTAAE